MFKKISNSVLSEFLVNVEGMWWSKLYDNASCCSFDNLYEEKLCTTSLGT